MWVQAGFRASDFRYFIRHSSKRFGTRIASTLLRGLRKMLDLLYRVCLRRPDTTMRRCLVAGAAAAALLGGAEAFAPSSAGALSRACAPDQHATRSATPALRMGLSDMFNNAFANNPNIPKAPVTGPGSPGFSPPREKKQKPVAEPEPVAPVAVWQEVSDPATGNPYWYVEPANFSPLLLFHCNVVGKSPFNFGSS